ncbi:hypothetical protein B0H14DRAFT_2579109 [Mycena olivaceomarginata]|nr:hypothetical protein B0H14DRAFT_2579109 [Mycena olivaceomarginata]
MPLKIAMSTFRKVGLYSEQQRAEIISKDGVQFTVPQRVPHLPVAISGRPGVFPANHLARRRGSQEAVESNGDGIVHMSSESAGSVPGGARNGLSYTVASRWGTACESGAFETGVLAVRDDPLNIPDTGNPVYCLERRRRSALFPALSSLPGLGSWHPAGSPQSPTDSSTPGSACVGSIIAILVESSVGVHTSSLSHGGGRGLWKIKEEPCGKCIQHIVQEKEL